MDKRLALEVGQHAASQAINTMMHLLANLPSEDRTQLFGIVVAMALLQHKVNGFVAMAEGGSRGQQAVSRAFEMLVAEFDRQGKHIHELLKAGRFRDAMEAGAKLDPELLARFGLDTHGDGNG